MIDRSFERDCRRMWLVWRYRNRTARPYEGPAWIVKMSKAQERGARAIIRRQGRLRQLHRYSIRSSATRQARARLIAMLES